MLYHDPVSYVFQGLFGVRMLDGQQCYRSTRLCGTCSHDYTKHLGFQIGAQGYRSLDGCKRTAADRLGRASRGMRLAMTERRKTLLTKYMKASYIDGDRSS